jgi:glycerol-3-phosphate cytidylyltransferase
MKIGFIAGCFDLIHPGYIAMFKDAKNNVCEHLIIGLHSDPSIERPNTKAKPVHNIDERIQILSAIKYIDEIIVYDTEKDLYNLLSRLKDECSDLTRILGSDYSNVKYHGHDLGIPVYFHNRNHNYSTTELRKKIK